MPAGRWRWMTYTSGARSRMPRRLIQRRQMRSARALRCSGRSFTTAAQQRGRWSIDGGTDALLVRMIPPRGSLSAARERAQLFGERIEVGFARGAVRHARAHDGMALEHRPGTPVTAVGVQAADDAID